MNNATYITATPTTPKTAIPATSRGLGQLRSRTMSAKNGAETAARQNAVSAGVSPSRAAQTENGPISPHSAAAATIMRLAVYRLEIITVEISVCRYDWQET